jgi:hypothetical protein
MRPDDYFPALAKAGYSVTSAAAREYNCIAWAAGVSDQWWWPDPAEINPWPTGAPREETLSAFVEAFRTLGYELCDVADLEAGFEKVALYAKEGAPRHAARQLPSGRWTSKLGVLEDVEHTLEGLVGEWYGTVTHILKRPRRTG